MLQLENTKYFIKTYSNEGDIVLDPFAGSSTTGVAALNKKRQYIGIDLIVFNINFDSSDQNGYFSPKNKCPNNFKKCPCSATT